MLRIDPEFKAIIPPLQSDERALLEQSIRAEGCRDAIVVWDGTIIDGHNRYEICSRFDVPFQTKEMAFADRYEAMNWIIMNQLGRRNLSDAARSDLRGKRYNNEKQNHGGDRRSSDQNEHLKTAERLAQEEGVSQATVRRDAEFSEALDILAALVIPRSEFTASGRKTTKSHIIQLADLAKVDPEAALAAWHKVEDQGEKSGAIKSAIREVANEQAMAEMPENENETISLMLGDFAELSRTLADESIDAIITDPPYPYQYIEEWSRLSEMAMRVLKPGGWCITYSGKQHLDEVMARMTTSGLEYFWQIVFLQTTLATDHARGVNTQYKPILLFQKPPIRKPDTYFVDVIKGSGVEKDGHEWQQSENGFVELMERFTMAGETIMDPFLGSGTCAVAASKTARRFIGYEIDEGTYASACKRVFGG